MVRAGIAASACKPMRALQAPRFDASTLQMKTGTHAFLVRPRQDSNRPSDDVEVLDPRHDVATLRLLALQLDHQAQLVDRVGVAQRILVADLALFVELEQVLVERLHAEL